MNEVQVDLNRVVEIIREENPLVLELAIRRARIEQLESVVAGLVPRPDEAPIETTTEANAAEELPG